MQHENIIPHPPAKIWRDAISRNNLGLVCFLKIFGESVIIAEPWPGIRAYLTPIELE